MSENTFLSFTLGANVYGFDFRYVKETFFLERFTALPEGADHIAGICALHEEVVTLFDLRKRFGLAVESEALGGHCITLKTADEMEAEGILPTEGSQLTLHPGLLAPVDRVGVLVDDLGEVIVADDSSIGLQPPSLKGVSKKYLDKLVVVDETMMLVLNIAETFTTTTTAAAGR